MARLAAVEAKTARTVVESVVLAGGRTASGAPRKAAYVGQFALSAANLDITGDGVDAVGVNATVFASS